jgi:hypothetical protein
MFVALPWKHRYRRDRHGKLLSWKSTRVWEERPHVPGSKSYSVVLIGQYGTCFGVLYNATPDEWGSRVIVPRDAPGQHDPAEVLAICNRALAEASGVSIEDAEAAYRAWAKAHRAELKARKCPT